MSEQEKNQTHRVFIRNCLKVLSLDQDHVLFDGAVRLKGPGEEFRYLSYQIKPEALSQMANKASLEGVPIRFSRDPSLRSSAFYFSGHGDEFKLRLGAVSHELNASEAQTLLLYMLEELGDSPAVNRWIQENKRGQSSVLESPYKHLAYDAELGDTLLQVFSLHSKTDTQPSSPAVLYRNGEVYFLGKFSEVKKEFSEQVLIAASTGEAWWANVDF